MADITIVRAINTCNAVPSQWDAWDSDNRYWYLRYRFGHGSAEHFPEGPTWYEKQQPGDPIPIPKERHYFLYGDELDGCINLEEFCHQIGFKLVLGGWAPPVSGSLHDSEWSEDPVDHGLTITGHSSLDEMWGDLDEDKPDHHKRPKKNRGLALFLSALVPGLGSLYARSYATAFRSFCLCSIALAASIETGNFWSDFLTFFLWIHSVNQADEDMFYYTNGYRDTPSYVRGFARGATGRLVIDTYERTKGTNGNTRDDHS